MPRMGAQMLHTVTVRTLALAACGWLLACEASALTLGRARGAALIGRPLELVIPVTLAATDTQGPCAGADLFYGEERVRAPAVRWEPGIGTQGVLRVTSTAAVDEPMVTLYLRFGCGQSSTRRFVLLSEPPAEVEPAGTASLLTQGPAAATAAAPAAAPPRAPADRPVREGLVSIAAAPSAQSPAPRSRALRQEPVPPGARLKLEPLDLTVDRDPTLRLTAELTTPVAADPRERQAAAALWHVLQKAPDQTVQDGLRLQAVERELGSLRDATRKDAAALQEMRGQLERAQDGRRTASLLVLALATLLAALLAWLALRWQRVRQLERVGRWFEVHGEEALRNEAATAPGLAVPLAGAPEAGAAPRARATTAPTPLAAGAGSPAREEFAPSRGSESLRMVGVEELIDVHDKVDFFLSIGEPAQAVSLLESHVHDHVETGALAWMELLELHHSLGRRGDYERVRSEFRQRFAVQVPEYEHFDQPGASLENHGRALSRIVALWPSRRVLDVIEESIFRKPGESGAEPFSLEAYRELVLLYHVATEMAAPHQEAPREAAAPGSFPETSLQPLSALERPQPALPDRERLMIPPASPRLGVDIDLEELPGPSTQQSALDFDVSAYDDGADITAAEPPRKRG